MSPLSIGYLLLAACRGCARLGLSVASAVDLILEPDRPFAGRLRLSDAPMQQASAGMGRP